jgi:hypothetical protein
MVQTVSLVLLCSEWEETGNKGGMTGGDVPCPSDGIDFGGRCVGVARCQCVPVGGVKCVGKGGDVKLLDSQVLYQCYTYTRG